MSYRVKCDQCEALVINGVPCHEQGCPNTKLPWHRDDTLMTCTPSEVFSHGYFDTSEEFDLQNEMRDDNYDY